MKQGVFFTVAALMVAGACSQEDIEYPITSSGHCQIPGVCDGSNFDDITDNIVDQNDCLFACQGKETCQSWTYHPQEKECWTFREPCMIDYNETACADCTSGDKACSPLYQCRLEVECSGGSIVGNMDTSSGDECLAECQVNSRCTWYTWDNTNGRCLLFDSCPSENPCSTCESGEKLCTVSSGEFEFGKVLLTGGYDAAGYYTEVLDVEGRFESCDTAARVYQGGPIQLYGQAGAFIGDKVVTCGGFDYSTNEAVDYCYEFALNDDNDGSVNDGDSGVGKWQRNMGLNLTTPRGGVGFAKMDDNRMWITGGYGISGTVDTTEIVTVTEAGANASPGVDLPRATVNHCIIKVNNSADAQEYVFLGGSDSNTVHYIDLNQPGATWQQLPSMPDAKQAPFCGYVENPDGSNRRVIVSAGLTAFVDNTRTYIYSWTEDITQGTWRSDGTPYPDSTSFGYSVRYQNTFLTGDGQKSDGDIYMYDAVNDNWGEEPVARASTEHYYGTAVMIPDSFYCRCGDEVEETTGDLTTCSSASQGTRIATNNGQNYKIDRFDGNLRLSKSHRQMWWNLW